MPLLWLAPRKEARRRGTWASRREKPAGRPRERPRLTERRERTRVTEPQGSGCARLSRRSGCGPEDLVPRAPILGLVGLPPITDASRRSLTSGL